MATTKTKGTNSKIKELKGVKPEKVTDEQLTKIQNLVNKVKKEKSSFDSRFTPVNQADLPKPKPKLKRRKK